MLPRHRIPYNELRRLSWGHRYWPWNYPFHEGDTELRSCRIPLNVVEEGANFVVHAAVLGVKPEDIEVTVEDNAFTIKAKTETENGTQRIGIPAAGTPHRYFPSGGTAAG